MCLTPTGRFTVVEGRLEPKVRASTLWIHHKKYKGKCRRVLEIFDEGKWKVLAAVDMPEEEGSKSFWAVFDAETYEDVVEAINTNILLGCIYQEIVTDQETSSTRLIRKYFNLESFDEDSKVITFSAMIEGVYKKLTLTTTGWSES